jgi:hypothetical protein
MAEKITFVLFVQRMTSADLKCAFLAKGRGARKQIKGLTFNHKLMLQMCLLSDEAGKTWSDTEIFYRNSVARSRSTELKLSLKVV